LKHDESHLLLPPSESIKIYRLSHVILLSAFYAMTLGLYDLGCLNIAVFITSLLHWRRPRRNSIYQQIDRLTVCSVACYEIVYKGLQIQPPCYILYIPILCGVFSYRMALKTHDINKTESAHWHCTFHVWIHMFHLFYYYFIFLSLYN